MDWAYSALIHSAHIPGQLREASEFRDVAFEDVGSENDSLLTLDDRRCGDFTPEADVGEGFRTYDSETPHPDSPHP